MLDDDLTNVETVVRTGNRMADAIFNSKLSLAAERQIQVKAQASLPVALTVSELDLCILIGNLMDNAMDACMELPAEKRLIRIYMEMKGNYLYLALTNTAGGGKKHSFATTKGRGTGLESPAWTPLSGNMTATSSGHLRRKPSPRRFCSPSKEAKAQLTSNFEHLVSMGAFFVGFMLFCQWRWLSDETQKG